MDANNIANYVKELENKVKRYEELLDLLSRPANVSVLNMKDVQRWAECVYINKEPIVNWSFTELNEDSYYSGECGSMSCGCDGEIGC